jgi:riboflavin-specific deaminase-like protein
MTEASTMLDRDARTIEPAAPPPSARFGKSAPVVVPFPRRPDHDGWAMALAARDGLGPLPEEWAGLFGPIVEGGLDRPFVVGQLGQSLDGRIATHTGHSKYINGQSGLTHLHRLRALCDAVIVGIGTAVADDPMLNVRLCAGPNPARIVIDPRGRLPRDAKLLREDGARRVIVIAPGARPDLPRGVEAICVPADAHGRLDPRDIVAALGRAGFRRMLLEGGAHTISGFISAGALDRLHMMVAPMIVGSGRAGLALPPIDLIDQALRPPTAAHLVGGEVIFDCDLAACRGHA